MDRVEKLLAANSILWAVMGATLIAVVLIASRLFAADLGDSQTRNMIRLSLALYAVALGLMSRLTGDDWLAVTPLGRAGRWCWTWACVAFLIHLGFAFHYFHRWSHQHAFEHTRDVSGFGEGIYLSYLFTLLWSADVVAWWVAPQMYANRSVWIDRLLHGFMLFIVFNGTIVYESGPIRWFSGAAFFALSILWLRRRQHFSSAVAANSLST